MLAKKRLALVISVSLGFSAASCGGGEEASTRGSDQEQIAALMKKFAADAKDKDYAGVCSAMSVKANAQLEQAGAFLGGGDCKEVIAKAFALDSSDTALGKVDPDEVKITALRVTGTRAVADVSPTSDDDPTTRFVREDGRWKIDADLGDDSSASGEAEEKVEPAPDVSVTEEGFSVTDDTVSYGFVLRNPAPQDAVEVEAQINLIGSDGGVVGTEQASVVGIPAGESVNIGGSTSADEKIKRLEISVKAGSGAAPGTVKLPKVSRVKLVRDDFGLTVKAQLTNTLDEELSQISDVFAVLRDESGEIVGGVSGFPRTDLAPGGRGAVDLGGFGDVAAAAKVDVTADGES